MYISNSSKDQLNRLLEIICFRLELSPTQRELAEVRYKAVGNWLAAEDSILGRFKPVIYPQGSLRIGTTTKPIKQEEYDLDLVCELQINKNSIHPSDLLKIIYARICLNKKYEQKVELKNRCVRLKYANEFHLDILPAIPDLQACHTCVWVPDRKMNGGWSASNPKGYANWFEKIAERYEKVLIEKRIEPLPEPEPNNHKPPLKRAIQLLKRRRDIAFEKDEELAPVSIVLTTLSAELYRNEASVVETFTTIINGLVSLIRANTDPLYVWNPTNRKELLSEKWIERPEAFALFKKRVFALQTQWSDLLSSRGLGTIARILQELFGENVVNQALKDFDEDGIAAARASGKLGMQPATGILSTSAAAKIIVPRNTFHGKIF